MLADKPNIALEKKLNIAAWITSAIVFLLIVLMRKIRITTSLDFSFLPAVYSALNMITAVILLAGLYFIKNNKVDSHRKAMTLAIFTSFLFLLGYVLYHITTDETKFGGQGAIRYLYFFLLLTHIVLAAVIFPFILFTFIRAFTGQYARHRKMARWVYWVWLYVAVSGPVLYLMIQPYYN